MVNRTIHQVAARFANGSKKSLELVRPHPPLEAEPEHWMSDGKPKRSHSLIQRTHTHQSNSSILLFACDPATRT